MNQIDSIADVIGMLELMKRTRFGNCCACGCDAWLKKPEQKYFASMACLWRFKKELQAMEPRR